MSFHKKKDNKFKVSVTEFLRQKLRRKEKPKKKWTVKFSQKLSFYLSNWGSCFISLNFRSTGHAWQNEDGRVQVNLLWASWFDVQWIQNVKSWNRTPLSKPNIFTQKN